MATAPPPAAASFAFSPSSCSTFSSQSPPPVFAGEPAHGFEARAGSAAPPLCLFQRSRLPLDGTRSNRAPHNAATIRGIGKKARCIDAPGRATASAARPRRWAGRNRPRTISGAYENPSLMRPAAPGGRNRRNLYSLISHVIGNPQPRPISLQERLDKGIKARRGNIGGAEFDVLAFPGGHGTRPHPYSFSVIGMLSSPGFAPGTPTILPAPTSFVGIFVGVSL